MNRKSRRIIAAVVAGLMLVMTFAEVPAVFAAGETGEEPVEVEVQDTDENEEQVPEGEDGEVAVTDDVEVFYADEPEEELPEEEPEGEPEEEQVPEEGSAFILESDADGFPIVNGEDKLFVRLCAVPLNADHTQIKGIHQGEAVNVKFNAVWTKAFDGSIKSQLAEDKYKEFVDQGWTFGYRLMKSTGVEEEPDEQIWPVEPDTYGTYEEICGDSFVTIDNVEMAPVKYYLEVKATDPEGNEQVGSSLSRIVSYAFPEKVTNVKASLNKKTNTVTLTWKKAKGATSDYRYYVYRSKNGKLPSDPYKKLNAVKLVDKALKKGTYTYFVRTVNTKYGTGGETLKMYSEPTDAVTVKITSASKYLTCSVRAIKWKAKLRSKGTLYSNKGCTKKKGTLKKGTKVVVTGKYPKSIPRTGHPTKYQVQVVKNNKVVKKGWVKYGAIKHVSGEVAYKSGKAYDWTTEDKEAYVNKKGYSSSKKYLIWVSTYTQRANIFQGKKGNWKLVKSFRCTTGKFDSTTSLGTRKILKHKEYVYRVEPYTLREYYFKYGSFFTNGNSFHSVCWYKGSGKQKNRVMSNLQPDTGGCIRMNTSDAIWIYNNIATNTKVMIH